MVCGIRRDVWHLVQYVSLSTGCRKVKIHLGGKLGQEALYTSPETAHDPPLDACGVNRTLSLGTLATVLQSGPCLLSTS